MRARTVEFVAPRRLALVDVDVHAPRAGELVVRTLYSGISSGTELLAYRGEIGPDVALDESIASLGGTFEYPFRYGYSSVGVVESSMGAVPVGTVVFVFHPHQDRLVCSDDGAVVLPGIDPRIATLFPLVETALQVTLDAGDVLGEDVVVMGLGAVGLCAALLLQRAGARVLGVEPVPWRRALAAELDVSVAAPATVAARIAQATEGRGAPLVVEASGNPDALGTALPLLAHEGTVLVASWYGTKPATLPLGAEFHRRRLIIRSSQVSTIPARLQSRWSFDRRRTYTARLLEELPLKRIATHEFPVERVADAFAALDRGDEGVMHVALSYPET